MESLIKKINILLIGIIICVACLNFVVADDPPELPSLVYGNVIYSDGESVLGVKVIATWTNSQGQNRKVTTETFKYGDLKGSYSFNEQINDAPSGAVINIKSKGISVQVLASPGILTRAPQITVFKNIFQGLFTKSEPIGGYIGGEEYLGDGSGEAGIGPGGDLGSGNSHGSYDGNVLGGETGSGEGMPGVPSPDFEGSGGGNGIGSGSGTGTSTGSEGYYGEDYPNMVEGSIERSGNDEIGFNQLQRENRDLESKSFKIIRNAQGEVVPYKLIVFVLILFLGGILFLIIIRSNRPQKVDVSKLKVSLGGINKVDINKVMEKKFSKVSPEDSVIKVVDLFSEKNVELVLVAVENKIEGVLSKRELLMRLGKKDLGSLKKIKIKEIMTKKFFSCKSGTKMNQVFKILNSNKIKEVIIKEGAIIKGTAGYFDILNAFNNTNFTIENPPILREAMKKRVVFVEHDTSLNKVQETLARKNSDYALVRREDKEVGIITLKDLIIAMRKEFNFEKTNAINVMSPNIVSMTPGTPVNEAIDVMLERKFNQIPIKTEEGVVGIVTIESLVSMYNDFLNDLKKRMDKENPEKVAEELD